MLTPQQIAILRDCGTEPPFSSPLNTEYRDGRFRCAGCGQPLFSSATKFDSGSGWPSFHDALPDAVATRIDTRHGMTRIEVLCRHCGGHLGHLFDDGPRPTGQRYCINGAVLAFDPRPDEEPPRRD